MTSGPPTMLDMYEVKPCAPEVLAETENHLRQKVTPERERLDAQLIAARENSQTLSNVYAALTAGISRDEAESNLKFMSALVEVNQNPACDILGLSETLRPLEHKLSLARAARDLLVHKLMPAVRLRILDVLFQLKKVELEEVKLLAFISQERTLRKAAEVFGEEGRAAIIGERTTALIKQTVEAERQLLLAEDELRTERKKQLTDEQQRYAGGLVTRAEAVSAIPACAALIA